MRRILTLLCVGVLVANAAGADAQTRKQRERKPAAEPPGDRRDRAVADPASPFHGKPYWQSLAQCGGIYFKLAALYNEAAILAQIEKRDNAANAQFNSRRNLASKAANAFFDGAERVLIADRGVGRDEAIITYDVKVGEASDRLKNIDAALQASKPCPALYQVCRASLEKICAEAAIVTN
jgi:hypothetical protein